MTTFLTAACLTLAAIAFAVGAHTLFKTIATLSLMYDYLDERLTALEDEWEPDTEIDDEDDEEIEDGTEPWTMDPDAWKHQ